MQLSGVESAIRELQREEKEIRDVVSVLRGIQAQRSAANSGSRKIRKKRRLSAKARRRISEAAKKRWAAKRSSK